MWLWVLKELFEEGGNLEANFRVSRDRIKLGRAEDTGENWINWVAIGSIGILPLCITWMIPPHWRFCKS